MEKRGLLFVFFTAIISGVSIFVNKFGVKGINPYIFTGMKNIFVAIFLFSIIILLKEFKSLRQLPKKQWLKLALIGLIGGSIPFLLFFRGLQLTTAVKGAFIHKTMFIFVAFLAVIFLKEKLNKKFIIGAGLLLLGNTLLLKFVWSSLNIGDLLILIATVMWATEITLSKNTLKNLTSNQVAFGRMFFGSLFIILFLVFTGQINAIKAINTAQFNWILITSCFLLLYVFTFYTGLKHIKASIATAVLLFGQIITFSLSYIFLDAPLTLMQATGMLLMVGGIITIIGFSQFIDIFSYPWRLKNGRS